MPQSVAADCASDVTTPPQHPCLLTPTSRTLPDQTDPPVGLFIGDSAERLTLAAWPQHRGTREGTRLGRRSAIAGPARCATCGYRLPTAATSAAVTACRARCL